MDRGFDQIVIGGGIGGLSAAIALAANQQNVCLLEKNAKVGGKCDILCKDGYHFDMGPSVLTLPYILDDLFQMAGKNRSDYLHIEPVEPGCRYFFSDGSRFDAPGTMQSFSRAIEAYFPHEAQGYAAFEKYVRNLWDISDPAFLAAPFGASSLRNLPWLTAVLSAPDLLPRTMMGKLERYFRDPRLLQLFGRFATYNGSSPYRTHANFNVIAHAELAFGSWRCRGGMRSIVTALETLALELGVDIRTSNEVKRIHFGRGGWIKSVESNKGVTPCASVIINQDAVTTLTSDLLAEHPHHRRWKNKWQKREPSSSAVVLLLAVANRHSDLSCHNVFFSSDYPKEFEELFCRPAPLTDPTLYVSIPSHPEPALAPPGCEGWFVLVNAPSLKGFQNWDKEAYADDLIDKLVEKTSLSKEEIVWRHIVTPHFYRDQYCAYEGSLYGPSSNRMLDAFFRAPNRFRPIPGLYFCGGSAHPGGGIPLVIRSGRFAAEACISATT